jgi:hypothetical protein
MDLFRPDLARTFLPGASMLPAADPDILRTFKSSIHTRAWFLLIAVEALCQGMRDAIPDWLRITSNTKKDSLIVS